jgi:hypothetical protein
VPFLTLRNQTEADGLAGMFGDQRSVLKGLEEDRRHATHQWLLWAGRVDHVAGKERR